MFIAPRIALKLGMNFFDKKTASFFVDIVRRTIQHRRYDFPYSYDVPFLQILLRETGVRRNDVIDIFIDELEKNDEKVFSQEELELGFVATSLLFFFAGIFFTYFIIYPIDFFI